MKLRWRRIFEGCWHGFIGDSPNPTIILEKGHLGRKLWNIEHVGHGSVTDGIHDYFSFNLAKKIARERLEESMNSKP